MYETVDPARNDAFSFAFLFIILSKHPSFSKINGSWIELHLHSGNEYFHRHLLSFMIY